MNLINSLITFLCLSSTAYAEVENFSLPSFDGKAQITGQFDFPNCSSKPYPTVIFVGGTGLFSRTGLFGHSGTPRDELFTDFAQRLNAACIAVARFDYRGVRCDIKAPGDLDKCIDQKLRGTVTPQTILDDIQAVSNHTHTHPQVDAKKIFFIGHSEGSLNISRLVARGSIEPAGITFFGGMTESTKSIVQWQLVGRYLEWSFEMDVNQDLILTNEEIEQGYASSKFKGIAQKEQLLSPTGSWTKESLKATLESSYVAVAKDALEKDPEAPYMSGPVVFSSYDWWRQFFENEISVLENLKDYEGPVTYHNGDIDSQTPGQRQLDLLEAYAPKMKSKPRFHLYVEKGHGLGSDKIYGPMDEAIADRIVAEIAGCVQSLK